MCDGELTFTDLDTGEVISLENADLNITGANVTLGTEELRENRHYNITIRASNIAGSARSDDIISKTANNV